MLLKTGFTRLYLAALLGATIHCHAQQSISGRVLDSLKAPVPYLAIGLGKASDSTTIKGTLSDERGNFSFESVDPGMYFISAKGPGLRDLRSENFQHDSLHPTELAPLITKSRQTELDEVVVSTVKRTIEFKNGNVIVNVANSPLAQGNSLYDILMRMPGVMVDGENITLQGKSVKFMIDDRLQPLAGGQLITMLKSINGSEIEKLELITNPSAKYDAAGSGGLINIVTKRIRITGFSGSAMYSYSQGYYANNYGQLSLNYKGKSLSVFTNYNFNYSDYLSENDWHRVVNEDTVQTTLDQHYDEKRHQQYVSLWGGVDWYISKKHNLSIRVNLRPGQETIWRDVTTKISNGNLGYNNLAMSFEKPNTWFWVDYTLNYEFIPDTVGTKLTLSATYSKYPDTWDADFRNQFLDAKNDQIAPDKLFRSRNLTQLELFMYRVDFEKKLPGNMRIESGFKVSYQPMFSDFEFRNYNYTTQQYETNSTLTNKFTYRELIPAAYAELSKELKKFSFRAGLRAEQTIIDAASRTGDFRYDRNYFNVFPVASIDYNYSDKHNYQISYNRRLTRADYMNFNPYRQFRSMLTWVQGNPYLNPQYTNNLQFRYTFAGNISNSIEFSRMTNYFVSYNKENKQTKELTFFNSNLENAAIYSYNFFAQNDFFKIWNISLNLGLHYFECRGTVDGAPYATSALNTNVYTNNQLALNKTTKLEVAFWGVGPWADGVTTFKPRGGLNIGVRKSMLDGKLNMNISLQDVLYTNGVQTKMDYNGQYSESSHRWDSRRIQVNLNYNFGKVKVQEKKVKENEEKGRAGR